MTGSVVLLDFSFGQGGGSKIRPALVAQADAIVSINVVVALVTIQTHRTGPSRLLIDIASPDAAGSGLRAASVALCEHLFAVARSLIIRTIGLLPPATMTKINACLKAALALQ